MKANERIRSYAKQNKVKWWQVAESMQIQESALSRKLRHELPQDEVSKIMEVIDEIATYNRIAAGIEG